MAFLTFIPVWKQYDSAVLVILGVAHIHGNFHRNYNIMNLFLHKWHRQANGMFSGWSIAGSIELVLFMSGPFLINITIRILQIRKYRVLHKLAIEPGHLVKAKCPTH